jgi:hypothetical protein
MERVKTESNVKAYSALAEPLLLNFIAAGEGRESAICDAASSLPVIEILDQIYRRAELYPSVIGIV